MKAWKYAAANESNFIHRLFSLVSQPSISAQNVGLDECAELVRSMMAELGLKTQLMKVEGAPDVVYGDLLAKDGSNDESRTLVIYNHYDVQPVEPLNEWKSDPFHPELREGKIFGRGAGDDKGELAARLSALECIVNSGNKPNVNLKWIVEGEEETGSRNLEKFVLKNKEMLRGDACLWEGGEISPRGTPEIQLGVKGLLYVEYKLKVGSKDLHSQYGPIVPNPAWRLVDLLKTIRGEDGKILIQGFYDDVEKPTSQERKLLLNNEFSARELKNALGVDYLIPRDKKKMDDVETITRLLYSPTANIAGFGSGYIGEGSKTIVPKEAFVKMDFRLVPNMKARKILGLLKRHLKTHGFGDIELVVDSMEDPAKTPIDSRIASTLAQCSWMVYKKMPNIWPTIAGTGPLSLFTDTLGLETAMGVGVSYPGSGFHAPNEHILVKHYQNAIKQLVCLFNLF